MEKRREKSYTLYTIFFNQICRKSVQGTSDKYVLCYTIKKVYMELFLPWGGLPHLQAFLTWYENFHFLTCLNRVHTRWDKQIQNVLPHHYFIFWKGCFYLSVFIFEGCTTNAGISLDLKTIISKHTLIGKERLLW